uniref:Uncharacterized protein n=1 Tax=Rheinheimera sp. BAL341 TaxID=1708203 RepID=A0A486XSE4_9GAMM
MSLFFTAIIRHYAQFYFCTTLKNNRRVVKLKLLNANAELPIDLLEVAG